MINGDGEIPLSGRCCRGEVESAEDDLPEVEWIGNGMATGENALGIKACGEAVASATPPARDARRA